MDETPRLPSAFPRSPAGFARRQPFPRPAPPLFKPAPKPAETKPVIARPAYPPRTSETGLTPVIPFDRFDAATQRFYACAVFVLLQAWKLSDAAQLWTAEVDSPSDLGFAAKWLLIDGLYFYFLPFLRIPWLTFTPYCSICAIIIMATINGIIALKYNPFFPFGSVLGALWRVVYGIRETSTEERTVKWYDIVHNTSHIQGKYIVHILPEGAAKLNPAGQCFCLGPSSPTVEIPIRINGTQPISIQLTRFDPNTATAHTIDLNKGEVKKLMKTSRQYEDDNLQFLPYVVKQPGLYRLSKVKDVTELDVRIYRSEALVVSCPKATIKSKYGKTRDACKGDMSDLSVEVEGLAPLHVSYSREMEGRPKISDVQRIHPESFDSPLLSGFSGEGILLEQGDKDLVWARTQTITIPLNETLMSRGDWIYDINSVSDGCGNVIDYRASSEDREPWLAKHGDLSHSLNVHERPLARFIGCDSQNPMELPKGRQGLLPLGLGTEPDEGPFNLAWQFTAFDELEQATEHSADSWIYNQKLEGRAERVMIKQPGLYTLRDIGSKFCPGDILEPSSCLVITPPEPSLTLEHDEILDKCSSSSIGLTIDLTLVGTKPFDLTYRSIKDGGSPVVKTLHIECDRQQVRFTPSDAGHYAYEFFSISDVYYENQKLDASYFRVEQTVKPLAGASFIDLAPRRSACIGEPVEFKLKMQGTGPWNLNYDLIHNGKRRRVFEDNITNVIHTIRTQPLLDGGEYSLSLTSVEDQSKCKVFLEAAARIDVRFQKPKAQFAAIEGKFSVKALEGREVSIPMRLSGESPWYVDVRNVDKSQTAKEVRFSEANPYLKVKDEGIYVIEGVRDVGCPGIVPERDHTFSVSWVDRPGLRIPPTAAITPKDEYNFVRQEVCEGDEDALEVAFVGSPPFTLEYHRTHKADTSRAAPDQSPHKLTAGLGVASVRLDTSKSGHYKYEFHQVTDALYDNPRQKNIAKPLLLEQTVHARPTALFTNPDRIYKNCLAASAGEDIIPIKLQGIPPFALTMNIKHLNTGKNEVVNTPHIESNNFNFRVPAHALTLGDHAVSVLKVKDARGCVRKTVDGPAVKVAVADVPTITAKQPRTDWCVGDRIAFTLAGVPPFSVEYVWNGVLMKANNQPSQFVRVAEYAGNFTITGLQDSASDCKVSLGMTNIIHEIPSARISEGITGIPEGEEAEILFSFHGTPPFRFSYTRSEIERRGHKPRILEWHSETTDNFDYKLYASLEGTYEVTGIEDAYCAYSSTSAPTRRL